MSIPFLLFWGLLLTSCAAAAAWGGRTERVVASMYLVAALATMIVRPALSVRYGGVEIGVLSVDALLLAGLATVVASTREWWVTCAMALQSVTVLGHVGRWLNPDLWRLGYQLMVEWTAWPTLLLLSAATVSRAWRMPTRDRVISPGSSAAERRVPRSRID